MLLRRCYGNGAGDEAKVVFCDCEIGVVGRHRLALFGHLEAAVDRPRCLGQDGPVRWAAAAADGPTPAVEERQLDAVSPGHFRKAALGPVQHPDCRQETRLLVRVGVAEHHFLAVAAGGQMPPVARVPQQPLQQLAAANQGVTGLE